jgi:hypothetical protein
MRTGLGLSDDGARKVLAAKSAVRAVVVVVVLPLLQFLGEEVGVVDDLAFKGSGLVIAEQEGWTAAKLGTLGKHIVSRALTQIGVTAKPREPGHSGFEDRERSPHDSLDGLYRALILAHSERVIWP